MISAEELVTLISKVGGEMADTEAKALIHAADKDGNMGIDFSEFAKFWEALHGEDEVGWLEESANIMCMFAGEDQSGVW